MTAARVASQASAAAGLLDASHLFAALPMDARARLASRFREESFPAGAVIVGEGEPADRFFLLVDGSAQAKDRAGHVDDRLEPGDAIGEAPLLHGGKHGATVTALSEVRVLALKRRAFQAAVHKHRQLSLALEEELALHSVSGFLGTASPFHGLDPQTMRWLAVHVHDAGYPAGAVVIRQGEPGDALYVIKEGKVEVVAADASGKERRLGVMGPGEPFGEQALLSGEPRSATVRTLEPVELLRLDAADFESVVRAFGDRESYFLELALRRQRPRRVEGWSIQSSGSAEHPYFILKAAGGGRYLRLSEQAAFLWDLMDGEHSVRDLTLAYLERYHAFGLNTVLDAMVQLQAAGFVEIQDLHAHRASQVPTGTARRRHLPAASGLAIRYFSLPDVDGAVTALYTKALFPLYTRPAQALLMVMGLAGVVLFGWYLLSGALPRPRASWAAVLGIGGVAGMLLHLGFHETAHAVTCKSFGRQVNRAGLGWYYFMPVAFVDTSDAWMAGRSARMAVAFAGPYTNLLLASAATLLIPFTSGVTAVVLADFALLGYLLLLVNMNPLLEYDGYYVLMDFLDIPNLRSKSLAYVGGLVWRGRRRHHPPRLARLFAGYGLLALGYVVFVAITILTGYQRYIQGAVGRFLPAAIAFILGWAVAGLLCWLVLRRAWSDLRREPDPIPAAPR